MTSPPSPQTAHNHVAAVGQLFLDFMEQQTQLRNATAQLTALQAEVEGARMQITSLSSEVSRLLNETAAATTTTVIDGHVVDAGGD